jgi:hypothetical protein
VTSWPELRARLAADDVDTGRRAAAALGALWQTDPRALAAQVELAELLAELGRRDEQSPGIAEAFLGAMAAPRENVRALIGPWLHERLVGRAAVLGAARAAEASAPELGGWLTHDRAALEQLVSLGYVELVAYALGRPSDAAKTSVALDRETVRALHERLCEEHGRFESAMTLATRFGVLRPEVLAKCAETDLDEVPARVLARAYGPREERIAHWVFFPERPFVVPRGKDDGAIVLARLRANALLPGDLEAELDRKALTEIPFPEIPGTLRRSFTPRRDVALDLAVRPKTRHVEALRLVRARRGLATVHALKR